MAIVPKNTLKTYFEKGDKPLESEFASLIDSLRHEDENIPISEITNLQTALDDRALRSEKNQGNGYAGLDNNAKVGLPYLPDFAFLIKKADFASLELPGGERNIYLTENDNKLFYWDGVAYVETAGGSGANSIEDAIIDGVTTKAPSQNAVFDALALKQDTIIANSIDNAELSQMPSNTVKVNNSNAIANATDLNLPLNTVLGRENGNINPISIQEIICSTAQLVSGTIVVVDARITVNSFVSGLAISGTGTSTSEIKWTSSVGSMIFTSVFGTDSALFGYTIII